MITPKKLETLYAQGHNISALLRKELSTTKNTQEIIEVSYDLQTGSYIEDMKNEYGAKFREMYAAELANTILSLCNPLSILEAGIGEATTFSGVLKHLEAGTPNYGFDLSWSRAAYAKKWLHSQGIFNSTLCTGDLLNIPFMDSSIDIVYTSHSIESNGGSEELILRELYRITRKYLILLEPSYELSNKDAKKRMDSHGYCKNLLETCNALGYDILKHELFPVNHNPLNPTGLTIIAKQSDDEAPSDIFACPKFKTPLKKFDTALYSHEALTAYPILGDIPCLRIENGILASKFEEALKEGSIIKHR